MPCPHISKWPLTGELNGHPLADMATGSVALL